MKPMNAKKEKAGSRYNIEALARGLEILGLFTFDTPSLSFAEIVTALKSNKSTTFRVLSTLQAMGYLERVPATRRYRPSLKVLQLGFTAINRLEVRQVARPYLEQLAQELDETVSLCVLNGTDVVYVDRVRNRAIVGVVLDIGSHLPAHCTTMGKILLADLPPKDLESFLNGAELTRYTARTVTEKEALFTEFSQIRRNGYALSNGELAAGLRAAGTAIRDNSGKVVAAINVSGSATTISLRRLKKEIVPALMRAAARISLALGYASRGIETGMVS
jgi:IclR family pca regulon transcriptional regulator